MRLRPTGACGRPPPPVAEPDEVARRHAFHPLRVKRVVQETADTRSFVLDVPPELASTYRYRPGQFCTFRVRLGDDELFRCYSMSSAPGVDADLAVSVAAWFSADAGSRAVHATQHLHGGMGADIEYPIHRYFLWGKQIELLLGPPSAQVARLGRQVVDEIRAGRQVTI